MIIDTLLSTLKACCAGFPDKRVGSNASYAMSDFGMAAFSVFFMQCPSFLSHQRALESGRGRSNCGSLFAMGKIPTDNHIRDMLDPVAPEALAPMFGAALDSLREAGGMQAFERLGKRVLIALDGTEYFTSRKLGYAGCQTRKRGKDGKDGSENYHSMLCAALVAPGHDRALPLMPEFITPQDGHDKHDCESVAVRRWLAAHGPQHAALDPVYLGDDLMSRQPVIEVVQGVGASFLFTAKPSSHKTLYEWIDGAEPETHEERVKKARAFYTHRYRWIEAVPIRDGKDAILVNWLEMEIVNPSGKTTYRNSFVTDLPVTADTVAELAACGRARWKIENEGFNTLKTKGYNLEHNFGHGSRHLASLLTAMNLLAFAFHTVCDLADQAWQAARKALGPRRTFFEDLRTITRYILFDGWSELIRTMITGEPPPAHNPA